jgi:hypothetical protein
MQVIIGRLGWVKVFDAVAVAGAVSVESAAIKIEYQGGSFSFFVQAISPGGTPDIKVELEESNAVDGNYAVPDDLPTIYDSLADENWHIKGFGVDPADFLKLKITGNAANPADTIVTGWVFFGG